MSDNKLRDRFAKVIDHALYEHGHTVQGAISGSTQQSNVFAKIVADALVEMIEADARKPTEPLTREADSRDSVGALLGIGPKPMWHAVLREISKPRQHAPHDAELLRKCGHNAGVYRSAIAVAIQHAERELGKPPPPALEVKGSAIGESLKAAAFDYGSGSSASDDLARRLFRAALVYAADQLEEIRARRPELDLVAAITGLYRLALELSK